MQVKEPINGWVRCLISMMMMMMLNERTKKRKKEEMKKEKKDEPFSYFIVSFNLSSFFIIELFHFFTFTTNRSLFVWLFDCISLI
jgi:hypothetical protein